MFIIWSGVSSIKNANSMNIFITSSCKIVVVAGGFVHVVSFFFYFMHFNIYIFRRGGGQWLSGRVLDSRQRGRGF